MRWDKTKLRILLVLMCLTICSIPIGIIWGIQGFQSESYMLIGIIFIVTLCVSFVISYFITRPIEKLTKNIDQISRGKFDINLEYSEIKELNNLTDSLDRVMASLKLAVFKAGLKKEEILENKANMRHAQMIKNKLDKSWSEHEFDCVFIFDENANILDCNVNMLKRFGYSKDEFLKLNLADIDALESKKDLIVKIKKVKEDGVLTFKTFHKTKDGISIPVYENLQFDKDKGLFKGIIREDLTLKKSSD
ncbi:MAG: PAS domain S-box protein [Promethearchaeota archaeon]|nr:MAG: PAS domain S-box protein [Candidatus Lokiarchaeota archaeon]